MIWKIHILAFKNEKKKLYKIKEQVCLEGIEANRKGRETLN